MTENGMDAGSHVMLIVADPADAIVASRAATAMSAEAGFSTVEAAEFAIVVRELATNILKYAQRGWIELQRDGPRITITANDEGPGIPSVGQALADGYSSSGSLGYGLGTVNRLMDHLDIQSRSAKGTVVKAHRTLREADEERQPMPVEVGAATLPKPGFAENGDAFLVRTWASKLLVGVIDGVGHGAAAKVASRAAKRYIEDHYDQPLEAVFRGVGFASRGTRGVVLALARFDWVDQTIEHASVGNIETRVLGTAQPLNFAQRRGILGANAPSPRVTMCHWPVEATLVLFSDGVKSHWGDTPLPDPSQASAMMFARSLLGALNQLNDDATVLVVKPHLGT